MRHPEQRSEGPAAGAAGTLGMPALVWTATAILAEKGVRGTYDGLGEWPLRLRIAAVEGLHPDTISRRCAAWNVPTRAKVTASHRCRIEVHLPTYLAALRERRP